MYFLTCLNIYLSKNYIFTINIKFILFSLNFLSKTCIICYTKQINLREICLNEIEKNEKALLFSETPIPDIFFAEHLSQIPGDYLKIYLYMVFLSKYNKDIKLNDLSKKLAIPLKTITEATKFLEDNKLILKKTTGYIIVDLQEATLHELYTPNLTASKETIEKTAKNKSRAKAIEHINNMYFQGIMGPSWYNDIDLWFKKYGFDEQVMIALFDYCYNRSAMHRNYVQTVAEAWEIIKLKLGQT